MSLGGTERDPREPRIKKGQQTWNNVEIGVHGLSEKLSVKKSRPEKTFRSINNVPIPCFLLKQHSSK